MLVRDRIAEDFLELLRDPENYSYEILAPYEEFTLSGKTYYFTHGGFLYRKDPGNKLVGGVFCGYLTDRIWRHRSDDG